MTRKEGLPVAPQSILPDIRPIAARGRSVDIVSPVLDLCTPLHPLVVRFPWEVSEFPREKPGKHDGHSEFDKYDTDNEDEGEVENDLGGDTTYAVSVDEAYCNDILKTVAEATLIGTQEIHSDISAVVRPIGTLHLVEQSWVVDLSPTKPLEQIHIDHRSAQPHIVSMRTKLSEIDVRLEYRQIPIGAFDIIPSIINLSPRPNSSQLIFWRRSQMTIGRLLIPGQVYPAGPILIEGIAREIPIQIPITP